MLMRESRHHHLGLGGADDAEGGAWGVEGQRPQESSLHRLPQRLKRGQKLQLNQC